MRRRMPRSQFFYLGLKGVLQRFLYFVLVISVSSFGTNTLRTSIYILGIGPHTFTLGREVSSVDEELRCIEFFFWNPINLVCASSLFQKKSWISTSIFSFSQIQFFFFRKPLYDGKVSSFVLTKVTIITLNLRVLEKILE